jgi:opacity protein-like surface antigen
MKWTGDFHSGSRRYVVSMKNILIAAVALAALPISAQAQSIQSLFTAKQTDPGFYVGPEGGLNWLLNSGNTDTDTGFAVGGVVGYDFVGPRVELEGLYRSNNRRNTTFNNVSSNIQQLSTMVNVLYDFIPGATLTPYLGAGVGLAFADTGLNGCSMCSTQFAYQGIVGMGWNIDRNFRVNLDARYYGTSNGGELQYQNNNFTTMLGVTYKFGAAPH